jgi:ABC-type polysaccharide transport system, permease component
MQKKGIANQVPFLLMLLPGVVLVFIYNYIPMGGIIIAFQKFIPAKGLFGNQKWIGLGNFITLINMPDTFRALRNTIIIAFLKIIANLIIPIIVALLLNEVSKKWFKKSVQTMIYLPNFLSWVIFAGIIIDILSPSEGIVNRILVYMGLEPIYFLGSNKWFLFTLVITDVWKSFGFATIVYLASLTSIDPCQYEASIIDGATRWKQTIYVTIPGMLPIIVLMATLSLGNILNAGFEQVFNLYNANVYETGDIIDTLVYRLGLVDAQYGLATAVGLFKSVVSLILISLSYYLADRFADYRIF